MNLDTEYAERLCHLRALCDRVSERIYVRRATNAVDIAAIEMLTREMGRAFNLFMKTVHPDNEIESPLPEREF